MNDADAVVGDLQQISKPEKATLLQRFFRTGKGQYAEGDIFLGITVPEQRKVAKKYCRLSQTEILKLLHSSIHEHRLVALLILVDQFIRGDERQKQTIYDLYLAATPNINNWDLVDTSADKIVGNFLLDKPKDKLYELANSPQLWQKRIAIIATFAFIRNHQFLDTIAICEILLHDEHDLIHKACGWMLREVGKRDRSTLIRFLNQHAAVMPRTMLRYALEKCSDEEREKYLAAKNKSKNLLIPKASALGN